MVDRSPTILTAQEREAEVKRRRDRIRFQWHEAVLKDTSFHRSATVIRLAGYIMHKHSSADGNVQFSTGSAAEYLGLPKRSVSRAKTLIQKRGWLRLAESAKRSRSNWQANFYVLSGGPEDKLFDDAGH